MKKPNKKSPWIIPGGNTVIKLYFIVKATCTTVGGCSKQEMWVLPLIYLLIEIFCGGSLMLIYDIIVGFVVSLLANIVTFIIEHIKKTTASIVQNEGSYFQLKFIRANRLPVALFSFIYYNF